MEDPVAGIFKIIQSEGAKLNPSSICSGEVVGLHPNIAIKIGDLLLKRNQLKVADYLMNAYKRQVELKGTLASSTQSTSGGSGDSSFASHSHNISGDAVIVGEMTCTDALKVGDEVAMLASYDGNTYYVLCKVV